MLIQEPRSTYATRQSRLILSILAQPGPCRIAFPRIARHTERKTTRWAFPLQHKQENMSITREEFITRDVFAKTELLQLPAASDPRYGFMASNLRLIVRSGHTKSASCEAMASFISDAEAIFMSGVQAMGVYIAPAWTAEFLPLVQELCEPKGRLLGGWTGQVDESSRTWGLA